MASLSNLPIEIWENILKHAILTSFLFSTAPFDYAWTFTDVIYDWSWVMHSQASSDGMWTSKTMREVQRTRTRLGLVCQSWKRYLDSPRIDELCITVYISRKNNPPLNHIIWAKRLEVINPRGAPVLELEGPLAEALLEKKVFAANLLVDVEGAVTEKILKRHAYLFPYLTALHLDLRSSSNDISGILDLRTTLSNLPCLTCLSIYLTQAFSFTQGMLRLPHLTTLSILFNHRLSDLFLQSWYLPSLRHLRLIGVIGTYTSSPEIKEIFALSPRLETLCYYPSRMGNPLPLIPFDSLWVDCPRLTRLQAPLTNLWKDKLPIGQSLTHIVNVDGTSITAQIFPARLWEEVIIERISPSHELRIITGTHSWANLPSNSLAPSIAQKFATLGIRYEDANRVTLEEYQSHLNTKLTCQESNNTTIAKGLWARIRTNWFS
jgi:hypothetical protein